MPFLIAIIGEVFTNAEYVINSWSNPHWWSVVIPSAYEVNLDSMRLDRMLYVAENSDVPQ